MRNLSNADIGIFFHIPNEQAGKLESVISCIRNVFDICSHSMVKDEYWNFYADNLHIRRSIHFSEDDTRTWEAKKSSFPANVDYIESTLIVVDKKGTEKKLSAYATLNPMVTETIPMVHNERTVKFSIPNSIWKEMERTQVVNTVQVACAILDASYACIDIDFFCPRSLYRSDFRLFGVDSDNICIEDRIPTVCWAQYISPRMLSSIEDISLILKMFPLSKVVENSGTASGIWLQLSKAPHLNNMKEREAFRKCLYVAMYQISPVKIAECKIPHMQYIIARLPLSEEERKTISFLQNR